MAAQVVQVSIQGGEHGAALYGPDR